MRIKMLTSMVSNEGETYIPKEEYDYDDENAQGLIDAGHAVRVPSDAEKAVAVLKRMKGGLVIEAETDPALVAEAKRACLITRKVQQKKSEK